MNERRRGMAEGGASLFRLIRSDEISYGVANRSFTPYYSTNAKRALYRPFDLLLPAGTYLFICEAASDDIYFGIQGLSWTQLDKISANAAMGNFYFDPGWLKDQYTLVMPPEGKPDAAGCRITFSKGSRHDQPVESSENISVAIWRLL